MLELRNFKII